MVVPPAPELAEESLPHEILFDVQSISVGIPTQPIHSTPNASPEHVFVTPLDPEIDKEEDATLSPLIPDNLTDSIPLDLEDLMHIPPGPLSAISLIPGTSYRQERTHQFSASNYDNLSVTPTISSLSLTPEHALSPECVLSPTPSSPGPDINTEDTQNQSMDDTIDWYLIE